MNKRDWGTLTDAETAKRRAGGRRRYNAERRRRVEARRRAISDVLAGRGLTVAVTRGLGQTLADLPPENWSKLSESLNRP